MAIQYRARYQPDANRNVQQTTLVNANYAAVTGTIVRPVQIVAYDDTLYDPATAVPGDPDTEKHLVILEQGVLQFELSAAHAASQAAVTTALASALDTWAQGILPAGPALIKVARGSRAVGMRAIS